MIATGLTFLFGFFLACLLALLLSPIVWRRSRRMARREFEATIPTSVNEIRASYDHVRAAAAIETRTREMDAASAVERAAHERANAGRISLENAGLRERNGALITLLSEHKAAFEEMAETLEFRESEFDKLEAELHETRHDLDLRSEELDALARKFRVLVGRADQGGVDTGFDVDDLGDDAVGERPSRVEMQKTLKALGSEIEIIRTDLRQEQSTVRERDATILDLLAGVATATALSPDRQTGDEDSTDATVAATVTEPIRATDEDESRTDDDAAARKADAAAQASVEAQAEGYDRQSDEEPLSGREEPFPQAPQTAPKAKTDALASARSFSSLFAGRVREALKRPQMQTGKPAGSAKPDVTSAASIPAMMSGPAAASLAVAEQSGQEPSAGSAENRSHAESDLKAVAPTSIARRLSEALQFPDRPLGTDDVDDETLRHRIVDLAARVIDQAAKIEGKASPIETILTTDRSISSLSRPRERQTLTDRVRVMRSEAEAAE